MFQINDKVKYNYEGKDYIGKIYKKREEFELHDTDLKYCLKIHEFKLTPWVREKDIQKI